MRILLQHLTSHAAYERSGGPPKRPTAKRPCNIQYHIRIQPENICSYLIFAALQHKAVIGSRSCVSCLSLLPPPVLVGFLIYTQHVCGIRHYNPEFFSLRLAGLSSGYSHYRTAFESFAPDISEQPGPNITDLFDTRNDGSQRLSASCQHARHVVVTRTHAHTTREKRTKSPDSPGTPSRTAKHTHSTARMATSA